MLTYRHFYGLLGTLHYNYKTSKDIKSLTENIWKWHYCKKAALKRTQRIKFGQLYLGTLNEETVAR